MSSPSYWCPIVRNRQIHEDLRVPLFSLNASFSSKIADVVNHIVWQLGRYLRLPRVEYVAWRESQGPQGPGGYDTRWPIPLNESLSVLFRPPLFGYPDCFPWFSSVVRQTAGYSMQIQGTARTASPQPRRLQIRAWKNSSTPQLRQSGLETMTTNQAKVYPSHN